MSVQPRPLTSGSTVYDALVRDATGREISKTFRKKAEAKRWEREQLVARDRGDMLRPDGPRTPFREVAEQWLASNPAKSENTAYTDRRIIETKLAPFTRRQIGAISPADVQREVQAWAAVHAPTSVNRYLAVASAIFNFACAMRYIQHSPCVRIARPRSRRVKRPGLLTEKDVRALCESVPLSYRALVLVLAETGMRPQEVLALRVANVDLGERPAITVMEAVTEVRGERREGPPKSDAGMRTLGISPSLRSELERHLRDHRPVAGTDLVFTTPTGAPVRYSNFRSRVWNPATEAAGIGWATLYDLRRANATAMCLLGVDLSTAVNRMGHSDSRLLLSVYAQKSADSDQAAAAALNAWLANVGSDRRASPDVTALIPPGNARPLPTGRELVSEGFSTSARTTM